jgi:ribose transport system substrate-binding protein
MKKVLVFLLALIMVFSIVACSKDNTSSGSTGDKRYIAVISKGWQHKFWVTVKEGAQAAADKYGVEMTFDGPDSESEISKQVEMLNAVMAKNPDALCLAALDTESVNEQLTTCKEKGIPVIGFDSGVPNAPEGSIMSTASTNNEAAGALGAQNMYDVEAIKAAIAAATKDAPVVISVVSQDATSASITGRTTGFVNKMVELCEAVQAGLVAVTGHDTWAKASTSGDIAVEIFVSIAASTAVTDCQTACQGVLQKAPIGVFCTNSGTVDGMLAATTDGSDLDRASGKYKDMIVVGFDSGKPLLTAITNEWFMGAVTQDPYHIGYYAVELAVKALDKETIDAVVDTGCKFYTKDNMADEDIAKLLYE